MDLTSLVPLFVNGGIAGVFLLIFVWLIIDGHLVPGHIYRDKCEENSELKSALTSERGRSDAAVAAAATTRDLLLSIGKRGNVAP